MQVDWAYHGDEKYEYTAVAHSDYEKVYEETFHIQYWSHPLAAMGRMGWELVGSNAQSVLLPSPLAGYAGNIAVPIRMVFFFKRPGAD